MGPNISRQWYLGAIASVPMTPYGLLGKVLKNFGNSASIRLAISWHASTIHPQFLCKTVHLSVKKTKLLETSIKTNFFNNLFHLRLDARNFLEPIQLQISSAVYSSKQCNNLSCFDKSPFHWAFPIRPVISWSLECILPQKMF